MAVLTTKRRNQLGEGEFALPGRRYPVHDAVHGRAALQMVAKHGTPGEKKQVQAAVHARYPGIGEDSEKRAFGIPEIDESNFTAEAREYFKNHRRPLDELDLMEAENEGRDPKKFFIDGAPRQKIVPRGPVLSGLQRLFGVNKKQASVEKTALLETLAANLHMSPEALGAAMAIAKVNLAMRYGKQIPGLHQLSNAHYNAVAHAGLQAGLRGEKPLSQLAKAGLSTAGDAMGTYWHGWGHALGSTLREKGVTEVTPAHLEQASEAVKFLTSGGKTPTLDWAKEIAAPTAMNRFYYAANQPLSKFRENFRRGARAIPIAQPRSVPLTPVQSASREYRALIPPGALMSKISSAKTTGISAAIGGLLGGTKALSSTRKQHRLSDILDDNSVATGQMAPEVARARKQRRGKALLRNTLIGAGAGTAVGGTGAHFAQKHVPALLAHATDAVKARAQVAKEQAINEADKFLGERIKTLVADPEMKILGRQTARAAGVEAAHGAAEAGKKGIGSFLDRVPLYRRAFPKKASYMSLSEKIAGTIHKSDFDRFEEIFKEAAVAEALPRCADVLDVLSKIASGGVGIPPLAHTVKLASSARYDVVQVTPTKYGYHVKWAAAPDGVQPQEKDLTVPQAQQALPPEALQAADEQGAATMTNVEAEPDPLVETPQPVEGFGMYKVHDQSGNELVGLVVPNLYDPVSGQPTPMKLFTNGSAFAIQPDMLGVLIGVSYNLPAGPNEPRGMGVFYKTDGKGIIATVPFTVITSVTVEGSQYYSAQTQDGQPVQITPSDGIRRPIAVSPGEIAMPVDYTWMPLNGEVRLMGAQAVSGEASDPMQQVKQAALDTSAVVRAWHDGHGSLQGARLSGPVFEKIGSGTHDIPGALFMLAAAGMPQNLSLALLDKAASTGEPQRMYGLRPLSPDPAEGKEALADACADLLLSGIKIPRSHCLLKEAMAIDMCKEARTLVGVDSLDSLLSLGFINAENVQDFVEEIPRLEETAAKLAELVFATQLGLQSVPKTAAVRAMNALEDVLTGLRGLKMHRF